MQFLTNCWQLKNISMEIRDSETNRMMHKPKHFLELRFQIQHMNSRSDYSLDYYKDIVLSALAFFLQ